MKKLLLVALTAMLLPVLAGAQFSISGKISDKNQQALSGASVSLINTLLSTQTDKSGNFTFRNIKAGDYVIRINYLGFNSREHKITITDNLSVSFELDRSSFLADEVIVQATRATENAATAYRNISKTDIEKKNFGQDLPYLLNQTPSVIITSDAGAGIGYTGIRIRGSDATRINVTVNGIPYNDSESQGTYFVDVPDFASSVDNIQIQRGVGTSTNGAGAFGASINIQTNVKRDTAYAELNNSFGSYGTWKNTVNVGTGLINEKFSFDGRLSRIKSDGYIDRASSSLRSYFLTGAYYGKNSLLRANVFSGTEKTYQAWNGVPESLLATNRTFNGFTYDDQTDNYTQDHYQLLFSNSLSSKLILNTAFHYTYGRGYYEEYKESASLSGYGIAPVVISGTTIATSDLIRRRWLDNDFYGITYSLNYLAAPGVNFIFGGAYNEYQGDHYGEVIWARYASTSNIRQRYYQGKGFKTDFNIFGKIEFQRNNIVVFGDLQYRSLNYSISGTDKNRNPLNISDYLNFFTPKVGLTYQVNSNQNIFASFSVASKEPNRDDYINTPPPAHPRSERLNDLEAGYRIAGSNYKISLNGYGMFYKNQLIPTGKINDVGEYIRQNVPESYRLGLELDTKFRLLNKLDWAANISLSTNKIKNFTEYVDDYDNGGQIVNNYENTDIGFSPSFISSSEISYSPFTNIEIALLSKYAGNQYLDNTSNKNRQINSFFTNDLRLRYSTSYSKRNNFGLTLLVNNIFNELYEANGYTFSYLAGGVFSTENYYFPQATRNFMLSLSLKF